MDLRTVLLSLLHNQVGSPPTNRHNEKLVFKMLSQHILGPVTPANLYAQQTAHFPIVLHNQSQH